MLIDKYKPKNLDDIKFQDTGRLKSYVLSRNKKPLLIHGPSGTGKTSSVYALANDLDYEIMELNSSDIRNKNSVEEVMGAALKQSSLFKEGKIILIDDIDGIGGNEDRGGLKMIMDFAEEANYPIIATAVNIAKLDEIKNKFILLEFRKLDTRTISGILEEICKRENISYGAAELNCIARIADGDARIAIMNLGMIIGNDKIQSEHLDKIVDLSRDDAEGSLIKIFKSKNLNAVLNSLNGLEEDLVDMFRVGLRPVLYDNEDCFIYTVEENLPYEYDDIALMKSFDLLSKADVFRGRIMRRQHYRYLVYIQSLIASICLAKESKSTANNTYRKTSRSPKNNKKLWWLVNKKKTSIINKVASHAKMSSKKAARDFGYYKLILGKNPLNILTEEEIDYLNL